MPFASVDVDDQAFLDGFRAAMEEYRLLGEAFAVTTADKVVEIAKELAPVSRDPRDPPGRLRESIHHDPPVREGELGVSVQVVAGGPGIRETIFMEFGTYKDRPHPYMRPALALAAGGIRSIGVSARLQYSHQAQLFIRRMKARVKVQKAQRRRAIHLTPAEARVVGQYISSRLQYRRPRQRRRRG